MSLLSGYKVITVTHHKLNVQDLGHFYIQGEGDQRVTEGLNSLKQAFEISEIQYLETCNRVSYLFYADRELDTPFLREFFSKINPDLGEDVLSSLEKFVSVHEGEHAIRHIFHLASSMDSLVVGEREIFRQYRTAYDTCRAAGLTGDNLRLWEKATVKTAKEVYNKTRIGEKALSIVSLAIQSLRKHRPLADAKVLLVGAGETNALVGKFLKKYDCKSIKIYNRSLHNAVELAQEVGAESYHMQALAEVGGDFDVLIVCTSANKVVIDHSLYETMLAGDQSKKVVIDLAVPRNVGEDVVSAFPMEYIDIESLKKISENNLAFRKREVDKALPIIEDNVREFADLYRRRQIEKELAHVPQEVRSVKERAMNEVFKDRVASLDPGSQDLISEMMDYMEKKCISIPLKLAKNKA